MVSEVVDTALTEVVRRLVETLHPLRIYLFGSRARGDETYDSDYDVLVLVEQKTGTSYQMERQAYGALRGLAVPIDIVVMSRDHFELSPTGCLPRRYRSDGFTGRTARPMSLS